MIEYQDNPVGQPGLFIEEAVLVLEVLEFAVTEVDDVNEAEPVLVLLRQGSSCPSFWKMSTLSIATSNDSWSFVTSACRDSDFSR